MRNDPELDQFISKWRTALRRGSAVWEGKWAIEELRNARYERSSPQENAKRSLLNFVLCEPGYGPRPFDMMEGVFAEVKDYEDAYSRWAHNEHEKAELLLSKFVRDARRLGIVASPNLKKQLDDLASVVETCLAAIRNDRTGPKRSPLGAWERLWPQRPRPNYIQKRIDLETRLEIQAAKMFRTFLSKEIGVSRLTIARLVVLVFLVAGLAVERTVDGGPEGFLRIKASGRALTPRNVYDKLVRKGID